MGDLLSDLKELQKKLADTQSIHAHVGREAMLPYFGVRAVSAGIRSKTGAFRAAVKDEGAPGNIFVVDPDHVKVGVDYNAKPYFRWLIEGGPPLQIRARRVRNLQFYWYRKNVWFVGPSVMRPERKPHPIYSGDNELLEPKVFAVIKRYLGL